MKMAPSNSYINMKLRSATHWVGFILAWGKWSQVSGEKVISDNEICEKKQV